LLKKSQRKGDFAAQLPFSVQEENLISVIYGAIDAGILRFLLLKDGIDASTGYMKRSLERIDSALTYLESQASLGQNFGVAELALICCFEWFRKRQIYEWKSHTNLVKIYDTYHSRPSLVKTRIPDEL
jgi:glutathione S-transferase